MNNEEKILELMQQISKSQNDIMSKFYMMELFQTSTNKTLENLNMQQNDMKESLAELNTRTRNIEDRVTKVEVVQENKVTPQLGLLFEGQKTIQDQIARLSVVDALQADVSTLKSAVKYLSSELEKIKQAM